MTESDRLAISVIIALGTITLAIIVAVIAALSDENINPKP